MYRGVMKVLTEIRNRRGLSQRGLAAKAAVSFRGIQNIEQSGHNWRIMTLERIATALGLPNNGVSLAVQHFLQLPVDSVQEVSVRMLLDGFDSWKIHLFNFVDAFRATHNSELLIEPPAGELNDQLRALCASTVEALCDEADMKPPAWCAGIPALRNPWFVSGIENLKVSALVESPARFRTRNIFVLDNFLMRA